MDMFEEALAINELIESKSKIPNSLLLLSSTLPSRFYHQVVNEEQQKHGSWYNYSGICEESVRIEGSELVEIAKWLFSGLGLAILVYLIRQHDEILPLLLKNLDRIRKFLRKGIASEQSYFIRETFGGHKPGIYSIVGSDQPRLSRGARAPDDKFGKAEELQLDELGKDLIQNLASRAIFGKTAAVQIGRDKKSPSYRISNTNVHSSGGPVPNLFTGKMLEEIKQQIKFDLTNGLYPLKTWGYPNGLVPEYNSREKIYYSDYGVILWDKKNPLNMNFSCLSTFGCHAYGSVAAARAITDFGSNVIKVDSNILRNITSAIKEGAERFYIVVQAKLGWIEENWDITEINLCEGPVEVKK